MNLTEAMRFFNSVGFYTQPLKNYGFAGGRRLIRTRELGEVVTGDLFTILQDPDNDDVWLISISDLSKDITASYESLDEAIGVVCNHFGITLPESPI